MTLTINLNLNDPNDDGRLRTAEIRDSFSGNAKCIFDANATLEAKISVYVEIELLFTSLEYDYDLLNLGPYELFKYGCPDAVPTLVKRWGSHAGPHQRRGPAATGSRRPDVADDYEVRQFARGERAHDLRGQRLRPGADRGRVQKQSAVRTT